MFKLVYFALIALAAVSLVNGAAIPRRRSPTAGFIPKIRENYGDHYARSVDVDCYGNNPSSTPTTPSPSPPPVDLAEASSPAPQPTSPPNGDDGDNEDCEEDPEHSTDVPPSAPSPTPTPSDSPSPAQPSSSTNNPEPSPATGGGSDVHTGGHATWFSQNGVAGACGTVHSDDDFIAALDYRSYGDLSAQSKYCGQKIRVSWQGKSVDVVVADACPTCDNASSVDLSKGAFQALADLSVGELDDITWETI